jgi:hypothetical protein
VKCVKSIGTCIVVVVAACGTPQPDELGRDQALLIASEEAEQLELELGGLQRTLLAAIAAHDTAVLSRLLSRDFRVHDTGVLTNNPLAVGNPVQVSQLSFIEVMAGRLGDRLVAEYATFRTVREGADALVYASGEAESLRTRWRRTPDNWEASHLIIMHPEAARRELQNTP